MPHQPAAIGRPRRSQFDLLNLGTLLCAALDPGPAHGLPPAMSEALDRLGAALARRDERAARAI